MSRYYWWRRNPLRKKLKRSQANKLKPFIIQQIEHGDFDHSDYERQAKEELEMCERDLKSFCETYKGTDPEQDHRYLQIERGYRKRYNKLMEDYYWDEGNRLLEFKEALVKHFEVDIWDRCQYEAFKRDTDGAKSFFYLYSELTKKQLQHA
tara:strand:- start:1097 stop:1549 length:453 start_codon:yes stop_codon:yes gene_type:complete